MSDIQTAQGELGKMTRILKAFEGVDIVLKALANAEQVGKELDAQNATRKAVAEKLIGEAAAAGQLIDDAHAEAANVAAKAKADADAVLAAAGADAERIVAESKEKAEADAEAALNARADTLAELDAELDAKQKELVAVTEQVRSIQAANEVLAKLVAR